MTGPSLWIASALLLGWGTWQVHRLGFWPTVRRMFLTGWEGGQGDGPRQRPGPQQQQQRQPGPQGQRPQRSRQERFEEVARIVQSLPLEDFASEEDLQFCSLHKLREMLRQRGIQDVGLERREAVEKIMGADDGNSTSLSCGICCEDYASGEVLRRLKCRHKFHLECVDRWFLSSVDYSRPVACPVCNAPLSAS